MGWRGLGIFVPFILMVCSTGVQASVDLVDVSINCSTSAINASAAVDILNPKLSFASGLLQVHAQKYAGVLQLNGEEAILNSAQEFAARTGPHLYTAWTQDGGQVKFDERNRRLLVAYKGQAVLYITLSRHLLWDWRYLGFKSGRHFVSEFAKRLRRGTSLDYVRPFNESALLEHCDSHCEEFGLNPQSEADRKQYAARAYAFARQGTGRMLLLDTVDRNGAPLVVKFHLSSGEMLVMNADSGKTRSYYLVKPEHLPRYQLASDVERFLYSMFELKNFRGKKD